MQIYCNVLCDYSVKLVHPTSSTDVGAMSFLYEVIPVFTRFLQTAVLALSPNLNASESVCSYTRIATGFFIQLLIVTNQELSDFL